ncbi:GNAT family N-acetyltransferase [Roseateles sp.]|uniref:GNAT family N-acetyltransferase n=1 Tax=Roseateles sp. TaxID=1971397 RepID=UPI002E03337E|nr:GNAT family N-acetyltransferase [Roseateles sp.]HEV6965180.1 GNAT family N-acetyltransferase [Roseateles sp.]
MVEVDVPRASAVGAQSFTEMPHGFSIRPMQGSDEASALARIWHVTQVDAHDDGDETLDLEATRRYIDCVLLPLHEVIVAASGGVPVGFLALRRNHVAQLHVAPAWQRRGIGAALLGWAKAQGWTRLSLSCIRERVGGFYEASGFRAKRVIRTTQACTYVDYEWRLRQAPVIDAMKGDSNG